MTMIRIRGITIATRFIEGDGHTQRALVVRGPSAVAISFVVISVIIVGSVVVIDFFVVSASVVVAGALV